MNAIKITIKSKLSFYLSGNEFTIDDLEKTAQLNGINLQALIIEAHLLKQENLACLLEGVYYLTGVLPKLDDLSEVSIVSDKEQGLQRLSGESLWRGIRGES